MDYEFVVAGGGIGGAVLAELLGRAAKRVLVLERNAAPLAWVRPEVLWPTTAQFLFSLQPRAAWESDAMLAMRGVRLHQGSWSASLITPDVLDRSGVQPWFDNPNLTRERLLAAPAFELRRGVEVVAVLREGSRVAGVRAREAASGKESEIAARWTVGDDGVQSLVRQACGVPLATRVFPLDFVCGGLSWPQNFESAVVHIWLNPHRSDIFAFAAMPFPSGQGVGLALVRPGLFDDLEKARRDWRAFLATDPDLAIVSGTRPFPEGYTRVRRPWGHAPRYGAEGAILLGDAAHPVSPAGGQGANMAVADARVLAELLISGHPNLLEEYERRRRPANERAFSPTRYAAAFWSLPEWFLPRALFRAGLRYLTRSPERMARLLQGAATAFQER